MTERRAYAGYGFVQQRGEKWNENAIVVSTHRSRNRGYLVWFEPGIHTCLADSIAA